LQQAQIDSNLVQTYFMWAIFQKLIKKLVLWTITKLEYSVFEWA